MKLYTLDDQATFYFVITEYKSENMIKAWTDNKALAQFYMEFHNCKRHKLRVVTKVYKEMVKVLNENHNDEISICNFSTKSDKKGDHGFKIIQAPATTAEMSIINDCVQNTCSTLINFTAINNHLPLLKKKYQRALDGIGLTDVIRQSIYNKSSEFVQELHMDELRLLFRHFKDDFN